MDRTLQGEQPRLYLALALGPTGLAFTAALADLGRCCAYCTRYCLDCWLQLVAYAHD